jgi:hypothetical protein
MPEEANVQSADPDERYGDNMLAQAHFQPGETAYMFTADFTREDLKEALFGSTRSQPKTLLVRMQLPDQTLVEEAQIAVRKVEQIYSYDRIRNEICTPAPDWYVEGEVLTASSFWMIGTAVRLYVLDGDQNEKYEYTWIQRISKSFDPNGKIETEEAFVQS